MSRTEIADKLKEILLDADSRNREAILGATEDTDLQTDLGLSSVNMLFTVIAIEEEFGVSFDDVGVADFRTLGNVITYIEGKLS